MVNGNDDVFDGVGLAGLYLDLLLPAGPDQDLLLPGLLCLPCNQNQSRKSRSRFEKIPHRLAESETFNFLTGKFFP
jgi:hypothetical protein